MEIIRTSIEDVIIFRPTPIRDERGYFSRTLDVQILAEAGIDRVLPRRTPWSARLVRRSWCAAPMAPCSTWSSTPGRDRRPSAK
jgi:dTDP-4-dehydrorhamnose 3,5-epimerase-like enzyme